MIALRLSLATALVLAAMFGQEVSAFTTNTPATRQLMQQQQVHVVSAATSSTRTTSTSSTRLSIGFLDETTNLETKVPFYTPVRAESGLRYQRNDWWKNVLNLPRSYVLYRIREHLLFNVAVSIVVTASHMRWTKLSVPMLGHNLLGGFLGLLLVFRQNTAYSRFWDACSTWSKAADTTRMMAVDVVAYIRPRAPKNASKLLSLLVAFPDALAYSCLGGAYPLAQNVEKLVIPRAGKTKLAPAMVLCTMMQETIQECAGEMGTKEAIENLHLFDVSRKVDSLASCLKSCEKILYTPVPWSYSRHASRFLTIYTATLPFAVVDTLGWLTIPVMAILCWCLFGIEEIGHLIEQPFVGSSKSKRAKMTGPYDIGLPVFVLSNKARLDVEDIVALKPAH